MIDGSLIFNTKVDTDGFQKGTNTIQSQTSKLNKTFNSLGATVTRVFSIALFSRFAKQAVTLASDLQEVQNVVDVSFGEMSYKMEEFAKTSIESFGMSELSAKKTGSSFMAMAKGMNFASEQASDMALSLTGLSADMASFYNISQEETKTALSSIYTGETETLKRYGILITEVNLQEYARQQGITKSINKMTQQEKVMLRYKYIMNATKQAQGDFLRTQDSWANQTRILTEQFKQLMTNVGQLLMVVLLPLVKGLNSITTALLTMSGPAKLMFGIAAGAVGVMAAATVATKGLAMAKMLLSAAYTILIPKVITFTTVLKASLGWIAIIASVLGILFVAMGRKKQPVDNLNGSFENLGDSTESVATGLEDITQGLEDVEKAKGELAGFDELNVIDNEEGGGGVPILQLPNLDDLTNISDQVGNIQDMLNTPIQNESWFDSFFPSKEEWDELLFPNLNPLERKLLSFWDKVKLEFKREFLLSWDWIKEKSRKAWDWIKGLFPTKEEWDNILFPDLTPLQKELLPFWEKVKLQWSINWKEIKAIFSGAWKWFTQNVTTPIGNAFIWLWGKIRYFALWCWNGIKKVFVNAYDWFDKNVIQPIWEGIKWVIDKILGAVESFLNFFIDGINLVKNQINKLSFDIPDVLGGGHVGFNFEPSEPIKLSRLATGTVVPANYGEFQAILGDNKREPEIVSPMSTMIEAFETALNQHDFGGNSQGSVYLDGEKVGRILYKSVQNEKNRRGTPAISIV